MACVGGCEIELDYFIRVKKGQGMKTKQIVVLEADEGMVLTDGKEYGTVIFPGEGRTADEWSEITQAEYEAIMAEKGK